MPVVDCSVVLKAGIGALPGGTGQTRPKIARLERFHRFPGYPFPELPASAFFHGFHKLVADAQAIVGRLAGDGVVRLAVPGRGKDLGIGKPVLKGAQKLVEIGRRYFFGKRPAKRGGKLAVFFGVQGVSRRTTEGGGAFPHGVKVFPDDPGTGDHRGDFMLFLRLPVDVLFHIGMIGVQRYHFGRAPRGSPALDCRCRAVAYLEKRKQPRRHAAAG